MKITHLSQGDIPKAKGAHEQKKRGEKFFNFVKQKKKKTEKVKGDKNIT